MISGPIPMPEMRVTRCASPKLGLWSSALYQVALWPSKKRLVLVNNLISTFRLILILHSITQGGSIYDRCQEIIKIRLSVDLIFDSSGHVEEITESPNPGSIDP